MIRAVLHTLFIALTGAYGLSVTLFLLLRLLVGESWTLVAIFNSFVHLLFLPALMLFPACLLLRRFRLIPLLLSPLLAFLLIYGPLFLPRTPIVRSDASHNAILTYNLKAQTEDFEALTAIIRAADADIVALQELTETAAVHLASEFARAYPYQALHPQPNEPLHGQGVLSRYPILSDEYWRIHLAGQKVMLDIAGQVIALYNVHPRQPISPTGFAGRAEEITQVLDRAAVDTVPVLLVGDFNMSDQSADYARITARYTDAYREAGWGMGFTFPAALPYFGSVENQPPAILSVLPPLLRLDYVFHDETWRTVEAHVWPDAGESDHFPLYVILALKS